MEESIMKFTKSVGSFCSHLQSSCDALKNSVNRRPIPLDSASSTFIQSLNRRVTAVTTDLNLLDSMSFDTVSFEELLGHCLQIYNKNDSDLSLLEDCLKSSGYVPETEIDNQDEASTLSTPCEFGSRVGNCAVDSVVKSLDENSLLMDESLSLKSLGLSDFCLATLASDANCQFDDPNVSVRDPINNEPSYKKGSEQNAESTLVENTVDMMPAEDLKLQLKVSKDDYESLPSYLKALSSWEDLLIAVEKINSCLMKKDKTKGINYFHQDEISTMDLGHKARTYLLLLVRMNQLVVETIEGMISYKVL